jgi:hypothetical protein
MGNRCPKKRAASSPPRDGLAREPSGRGRPGAVSHRLDPEATIGVHRTLARDGWPDFVLAFHDREEIGPRMLARIARRTGLRPEDL